MRLKIAGIVLAAGVLVWLPQAHTAPQPSEIPVAWELDFEFQPLTPVRIHVPGEAEPRLFWYMRYDVANRTGADRIFVPNFQMYTTTGQLRQAGSGVPAYVFDYLKGMLNDPFLRDVPGITGRLLQGEDNARTGIAIWPDFDPAVGEVEIFVGGLSGENVHIQLPAPVDVTEVNSRGDTVTVQRDHLLLTKTLSLRYRVPGQAASRHRVRVTLDEQRWVMR